MARLVDTRGLRPPGHKRAQTSSGASKSHSRSWRRRAPWDMQVQNRSCRRDKMGEEEENMCLGVYACSGSHCGPLFNWKPRPGRDLTTSPFTPCPSRKWDPPARMRVNPDVPVRCAAPVRGSRGDGRGTRHVQVCVHTYAPQTQTQAQRHKQARTHTSLMFCFLFQNTPQQLAARRARTKRRGGPLGCGRCSTTQLPPAWRRSRRSFSLPSRRSSSTPKRAA